MANYVDQNTRLAIKDMLSRGLSYRQIASALGIVKNTVMRYAKEWELRATCPCGQSAGHHGWCEWRFRFSPARDEWMQDRWQRRGDASVTRLLRVAAAEARALGHEPGPMLWSAPSAASLAFSRCRSCGAIGYVKTDGAVGRMLTRRCLSPEQREARRIAKEEKRQWLEARRTLAELRKALRLRSPKRASTQAHSSLA